jgi:hypothetical protein
MNCPNCVEVKEILFFGGRSHTTVVKFKPGYCEFCKGKREINWLENIFGVETENWDNFWDRFTKGIKK